MSIQETHIRWQIPVLQTYTEIGHVVQGDTCYMMYIPSTQCINKPSHSHLIFSSV